MVMRTLVVASVVGAFALGLSSCGTQSQVIAGDEPTATTPSARSEQIAAAAADLFYQWYGTTEDRTSAEFLVAHALNGDMAECMADQGYEWDGTLAAQAAIPEDPLGPSIWTNAPMSRIFSNPYLANAAFMRAERVMNADDGVDPDEAQAQAACEESSPGATDAEIDATRHPQGQEELMADWRAGLRKATAEFGGYDVYAACLADADISLIRGEENTAENFQMALRQHAPQADDLPREGQPDGTDAWQEFLELESQWVDADWTCRADTYDEAMAKVPAFLDQFQDEHAEEINQVEATWADTREDAAALGLTL